MPLSNGMNPAQFSSNRARKILVVDDNPEVRRAVVRVLCPTRPPSTLASIEADLFESSPPSPVSSSAPFDVTCASQGAEGFEIMRRELAMGVPFAAAIVDMRMPPGWTGVETIERMLEVQPELEVAICSAYSDFSWHEVIRRVKRPSLRLLHKPFTAGELVELTWSLVERADRHHSYNPRAAP